MEAFIREVPAPAPAEHFTARRVALYSFTSDCWGGAWWRSLAWERIRTWSLREQPAQGA